MDSRQRQRLFTIAAAVCVPLMVLLWIDAARRLSRRAGPPPPAPDATGEAPVISGLPQVLPPVNTALISDADRRLWEQKNVLARKNPVRNPFLPSDVDTTPTNAVPHVTPQSTGPQLRLSAIVKSPDPSRRMVMINGSLLKHGDTIDGWKVDRIENDSVTLGNGTTNVVLESR